METGSLIFIFVVGLCLGSFLNVLVYRLPNYLPLTGRSFCPKCKKKIAWFDNLPLLSFILLRGKCRQCHSPISWQYPIVELTTGVLTVLIFNEFSRLQLPSATADGGQAIFKLLFNLLIIYALIVIFFTDLHYEIIPDQIIYPAIFLAILVHLRGVPHLPDSLDSSQWQAGAQHHLEGALVSGFSAAGFFFVLYWLTHGKGIGFGDVKLALLMGLFLGFPKILVALYMAFLTGAIIGVLLILTGRKKLHSHLPFGPFLVGATILSLFFGEALWQKIIPVLLQ